MNATRPASSDAGRRELSTEFWCSADLVGAYDAAELRPVEAALLERHRAALSGRVLEIGCRGRPGDGHLCAIATEVHGIDISEAMVAQRTPRMHLWRSSSAAISAT